MPGELSLQVIVYGDLMHRVYYFVYYTFCIRNIRLYVDEKVSHRKICEVVNF